MTLLSKWFSLNCSRVYLEKLIRALALDVPSGAMVLDAGSRSQVDALLAAPLQHLSVTISRRALLTVSTRVGHASAKMTLDVYGHSFKADQQSTIVLDKLMALWKLG